MHPELTAAQELVSGRLGAEGAVPCALGNGSVFLYRSRAGGTERWLVNPRGQIVEFEQLDVPHLTNAH